MDESTELSLNDNSLLDSSGGASASLSAADIRKLIYLVRGQQVMLDSDLALLYGVETKVLNQAVSRNARRFPERFCFRLTKEEAEDVRSQIVTLHPELGKQETWWRYMPRVFTEQGVSMLSAVLRSDTAIETSILIMDSFVEMRRFVASNSLMFEHIRSVELRQLEYERTTDERFEKVFGYLESGQAPIQRIFYEGQIYDAFSLLVDLVKKAREKIVLVDGYVDTTTLDILSKKGDGVEVAIYTKPNALLTPTDISAFNAQYPRLEVFHTNSYHDRYLLIDGKSGYLIGASLKDAGKRSFAITRLLDDALVASLQKELGRIS